MYRQQMPMVCVEEALALRVGRYLREKSFDLAGCTGVALDDPFQVEKTVLGVLYTDPEAKPKRYLFGLIKRKPRRAHIMTIWFSNGARNATAQNWVCEVHGDKYAALSRQLVDAMSLSFNVNIRLRLESGETKEEVFLSDLEY